MFIDIYDWWGVKLVIEMKNRRSFLLSGLVTVTVTIAFIQFGLIQFDTGGIYADEPASHIQDSPAVSENKAVINYYQLGYDQAEADLNNGKWGNDKLLSRGLGVAGCLFTAGGAYLIDRLRSVDTMAIKTGLNVKIDEMSDGEIKFYVSGYEKRIKEMRFWTSTAGFFGVPIVLIGILVLFPA